MQDRSDDKALLTKLLDIVEGVEKEIEVAHSTLVQMQSLLPVSLEQSLTDLLVSRAESLLEFMWRNDSRLAPLQQELLEPDDWSSELMSWQDEPRDVWWLFTRVVQPVRPLAFPVLDRMGRGNWPAGVRAVLVKMFSALKAAEPDHELVSIAEEFKPLLVAPQVLRELLRGPASYGELTQRVYGNKGVFENNATNLRNEFKDRLKPLELVYEKELRGSTKLWSLTARGRAVALLVTGN